MFASFSWQRYQRIITGAVLERRMQRSLISKEAQKRFLYQRRLVQLLAENYPRLDAETVESIAIAHFLHFQHLHFTINHRCLPFHVEDRLEAMRALRPLRDESEEIVFTLLHNPADRERLETEYHFLNEYIIPYSRFYEKKEWISNESYVAFETPFAKMLHLPVWLLSLLSGDSRPDEILISGLTNYFLGKKTLMDIIDFRAAAAAGVWNYVQSSFAQRMMKEGISVENMPASKKIRYFYVSGTAEVLYDDAVTFFKENIESWDSLPEQKLKLFPVREIEQIGNIRVALNRLISRAAQQTGAATG